MLMVIIEHSFTNGKRLMLSSSGQISRLGHEKDYKRKTKTDAASK